MSDVSGQGGAGEPALPWIDEHATELDATPAVVWVALLRTVEMMTAGRAAPRYARAVGCADTAAGGPRPLEVGSTVPGFHVAALAPERLLALRGSHRFSEYELAFRLEPLGGVRTRLLAETRADFPGLKGRAYRALVIGTRMHALAVRRVQRGVARRVERARVVAGGRAPGGPGASAGPAGGARAPGGTGPGRPR